MSFIKSHLKSLSLLSVIAGLLYNSWPLGHWLNPVVSKTSLASGLEAVHQPYNWVFIGGDVLSSLIVIILYLFIWHKLRDAKSDRSINIALICMVLFGIGTIVDALLPLKCVQGIETCPSFTHDYLLLTHGIFSILASTFLFISLLILWFRDRHNPLIDIFLFGYVVFGAVSLAEAVLPGKNGNWSQDYYISLCSVWIAVVPYLVNQVLTLDSRSK